MKRSHGYKLTDKLIIETSDDELYFMDYNGEILAKVTGVKANLNWLYVIDSDEFLTIIDDQLVNFKIENKI